MSKNFAIRPVPSFLLYFLIHQQTGNRAKSVNAKQTPQKGGGGEEEGKNPALLLFEDDLFAELFNARCHDTGEPVNGRLFPYENG